MGNRRQTRWGVKDSSGSCGLHRLLLPGILPMVSWSHPRACRIKETSHGSCSNIASPSSNKVTILRQELLSVTAKVRSGVTRQPRRKRSFNSFRNVRGRDADRLCIFDECSFWRSDDSANPDLRPYRAVRRTDHTTPGTGMLFVSTPPQRWVSSVRSGMNIYGCDDDATLLVRGPSRAS